MNDLKPILDGSPTDFEARLLGSVRLDVPPLGGKARVFAAVSVAPASAAAATAHTPVPIGVLGKWLALGALAGSVTTASVVAVRFMAAHSAAVAPATEITTTHLDRTLPRPASVVVPPPSVEVAPLAEPVTRMRANARAVPVPSTPRASEPSLSNEVAALDGARRALEGNAAERALGALDEYARTTSRPRLGPEATVLRIEALLALGRRSEARSVGERFLVANPSSTHAPRVRSLLGDADDGTIRTRAAGH
jgi:hypothetical protein